jgi:hypothetical protein
MQGRASRKGAVLLAGVLALCGLGSAGAGAASAAPGYRLAFGSTIDTSANGGPLIVKGHRSTTTDPMIADQVIKNPDAVRLGIGQLIYEAFPDSLSHRHWHYKAFVRYQLRSTSDLSLVRPDNKAGFCLSDPEYAPDFCGSVKPDLLTVDEGLGPGTSDYYPPTLEGQYIDITGVPRGDYWLVHWVNSGKEICESNYANNAAAVKIELWPNGYGVAPYVTQKEAVNPFPSLYADLTPPLDCDQTSTPGSGAPDLAPKTPAELESTVAPPGGTPPSSTGPPSAPTLSKRLARRYVVRALTKRFQRRPKQLRQKCRRVSQTSFRCRVQWRYRQYRYRGSVRIFTVRTQNDFERRFDLRVRRTDRRCVLAHARGCSRTFKAKNRRLSEAAGSAILSAAASHIRPASPISLADWRTEGSTRAVGPVFLCRRRAAVER